MAYTTDALTGIKAYAITTANGKYYFGGDFETKKNRVVGDFLGNLQGEMNADGSLVLSISDPDFGTLYYLATKVYLLDEFGNRLEINSNGDWDVVGTADVDNTDSGSDNSLDNGWGGTTDNKSGSGSGSGSGVSGWLGGITDLLKGAGTLLNGSKTANSFDDAVDTPSSNGNVLLYVIIGVAIIIIGVTVYVLTKKKKPLPVQNTTISTPLAGISKPKRLR